MTNTGRLWSTVRRKLSGLTKNGGRNRKLLLAVEGNKIDLVVALLSDGASPSHVSSRIGYNSLHIASARGFYQLVRAILDNNNDDDEKKKGDNQLLLEKTRHGKTAFDLACEAGFTKVCNTLLLHDPSLIPHLLLPSTFNTVATVGNVCMLETLISILLKNTNGAAAVEVLNSQENDFLQTPLMCAARAGHADIVQVLVDNEFVSCNLQDRFGNSALHLACEAGHYRVVYILLASEKADIYQLNNNDLSSIDIAKEFNQTNVMTLLASAATTSNTTTPVTIEEEGRRGSIQDSYLAIAKEGILLKNRMKYASVAMLGPIHEVNNNNTGGPVTAA